MGLMSENRDPERGQADRKSEEFFDPLTEMIAEELLARTIGEIGLDRSEDAHGVAELIAAAVLDRFVVRPRPADPRSMTK